MTGTRWWTLVTPLVGLVLVSPRQTSPARVRRRSALLAREQGDNA